MSADRRPGTRRPGSPRPVAGHVARKRFGQHFLSDRAVLAAIVAAIRPQAGDGILEIGPGLGVLTAELLGRVPRIAAVEIDRDLCGRLRGRFGPDRLELFEADALGFDSAQALRALGAERLRVVGNLPYNISSPLMVSLVEVPPEAFDPPPRVDSAVLRMIVRGTPLIDDLGALQAVLAPAFAQRRKMIRSTLLPWLNQRGVPTDGLDGEWRAEDISVARYCELARQLRSISSIL